MTTSGATVSRCCAIALLLVMAEGGRTLGQEPVQDPPPRTTSQPPDEPVSPLGPILPPSAIPLGTPIGVFFEPSVVAAQSYDDNLFLSPGIRSADFFTRVTPGLQAGIRTSRVLFAGSAQFDAERYTEQKDLDTLQARRYLALDINGLVTPRLAILGSLTHAFTTTPSELNLLSGIVLGRADATRLGGRTSFILQTSPRGRLSGGYALTHDELTGFASVLTHEATTEYRHAVTNRAFVSADYTLRHYDFDDALPQHPSHVFAFGVGYAISPTTLLSLRGGPRLSKTSVQPDVAIPLAPAPIVEERSIDPEWRLQLERRGRRGDAELFFSRSQTTAIGQNRVIDTIAAGATLRYQPAARVELRMSPAVYRDTSGGLEARVLRLAAELVVWLGNHIALVSQYSGSYQDTTRPPVLSGPEALTTVRQNVVSVGLRASARRRVPPREPGASAQRMGQSR